MTPTEAECTTTIVEAAQLLGYRVAHFRPARTMHGWRTALQGDAGWPDLAIVGHGRIFVVELKRRGGKVTDDQQAWIDALDAAGVWTGVVYVPEGQQAFVDLLAGFAQRRTA